MKKPKICGIYKITSPVGKIYIGQSVDIVIRKSRYAKLLCKKQHIIYNSILKYGWKQHIFEILCECDMSELNDLEKHYIKQYDCFNTSHGMNLTNGGGQANTVSDETRRKLSESHMGNKNMLGHKHSEETKLRISSLKIGTKLSNETKQKMSISRMGRVVSNETKQKISDGHKGKKLSEFTKNKLRNANLGKKCSEETKEKLRAGFKNRDISDDLRLKLSLACLGKKCSDETKRKISEKLSKTYKIYDQDNKLIHIIKGNFVVEIKKINLTPHKFIKSYQNKTKILKGKYKDWYVIKC